jgi:hypothetical protein
VQAIEQRLSSVYRSTVACSYSWILHIERDVTESLLHETAIFTASSDAYDEGVGSWPQRFRSRQCRICRWPSENQQTS